MESMEACVDMQIGIPEHGMAVFKVLTAAGFDAWFVGGYVRDAILGRPAHDVDIATDAHWTQVQATCEAAGFRTHETGTKHGTLTVVPDGEHAVEVTTFRADGAYHDGRHPESVTFVGSIREDLKRRDFTMNALAYQPEHGLFDPLDGLEDIRRGVIRVVGAPEARFKEDALRILRACRFASQLGFCIEEQTLQAMRTCKHLMANVSQERKTHELDELLMGSFPHDALMATADVLVFVLPELAAMDGCEQRTKYHCFDVLEHTAWAVQFAEADRLVRWAALCHDMGKPASAFLAPDGVEHFYGHAHVSAELARGVARRMLMSRAFATDLTLLVRLHDDVINATPKSIRRHLAKVGGRPGLLRALLQLKKADMAAHAPEYAAGAELMNEAEQVLDAVIAEEAAYDVRMLAVDGHDLMEAGVPEGPEVGRVLKRLLEDVMEERLPNERGALMEAARSAGGGR